MKKQFVLVRNTIKSIFASMAVLLLIPSVAFAQTAINTPVGDLLTRASFFIREIIIPVLFGIAFLFFLINLTRYYIIGATNEESRAKARRNTLYGLAAFVFLISIWGIITLLLNGIGIEKSSSICPDYIENCGEDITRKSGSLGKSGVVVFPGARGGTNPTQAGGSGNNNGTGNVGANNGTGGTRGQNFSGLAELIFGTGKDGATFTTFNGSPRAVYQTPQISSTAICTSGLNTLTLANRTETTQAAYVLYKTSTGSTRWENITDLNSANHISYDKDALDTLLATGITDVYIIHTHPDSRAENLDLIMESHGPSASDFKAMCSTDATNTSYAVVDRNGIWTYQQQTDTCPYSNNAYNILPIIETYGALASLEASTRQSELLDYISSTVTPTQYREYFSTIDTQQFPSMTPEEVLALSSYYQTYASTTISYSKSAEAFCSTF